jgi:predicted metal-dependent phosphotriesterase family hydrolase
VTGRRDLGTNLFDAHAHLWIQGAPRGPDLTDHTAILTELQGFAALGGDGMLDCQPPGCGRSLARLRRLARHSGLAIVASTGFHLMRYYPTDSWFRTASEDQAAALICAELTSHLVGCIKAAWSGTSDPRELELLRAACSAAVQVGAPMVVHTEKGRDVERLVTILTACGVEPARVQLSHLDKRPDAELHRELSDAGFLLGYDTFLRPAYDPERNVWPLLELMLADGRAHSIACGLDLAEPALWRFGGGAAGVTGLVQVVVPGLRGIGADEGQIQALAGDNVRRFLTGTDMP